MDIITVRIYKSKAIYLGKDVTDLYGKNWEFQPDVKNRQIKARPSIKTGRVVNGGCALGIAAVMNKIGVEHLFVNRTAVTQIMTMGNDGWFTTNIEHPRTKAQRKIDVKKNIVKRDSVGCADKIDRRHIRLDGEISLCIKRGQIRIPPELSGKVSKVYVSATLDGSSYKISMSTTRISTQHYLRKARVDGEINFSDIKLLCDYFDESVIRSQTEYDRGVYTATIKLGDKIEKIDSAERKPIEINAKPDNQKMTFWQRVKFVFGW